MTPSEFDFPDSALEEVKKTILQLDPDGSRWAAAIRHTYDMIYNGQETGRYRWAQLMKTEKTHFGTLFEINAQREFEFEGRDEDKTDYRIAGHLVDAKWSQNYGGWMLPPEVFDELALVATGDDNLSRWSLGLIRIRDEYRREGSNRDKKSQLNKLGNSSVNWIYKDQPLRTNVLLQLPQAQVDKIFRSRHGTQRTHELFRVAEGMVVNRNAVSTVSRQLDAQRRVRYNGGSRSALKPEGYLIFSGQYHGHLIEAFGLPPLLRDEYVSIRVGPAESGQGVLLGKKNWRRLLPGEPARGSAPKIVELMPDED